MREQRQELMVSLTDYLPRLYSGIESVVEKYRASRDVEANELIVLVIDGLNWTIDALTILGERNFEEQYGEILSEALQELLNAIENQDTVLIADILEYEILDKVTSWIDYVVTIEI